MPEAEAEHTPEAAVSEAEASQEALRKEAFAEAEAVSDAGASEASEASTKALIAARSSSTLASCNQSGSESSLVRSASAFSKAASGSSAGSSAWRPRRNGLHSFGRSLRSLASENMSSTESPCSWLPTGAFILARMATR